MAKKNSGGKPNSGAYSEPADTTRFVPLGADHCYLRDPNNGKTYHLKINSELFFEKIESITTNFPKDKLLKEIKDLAKTYPNDSWGKAYAKLNS